MRDLSKFIDVVLNEVSGKYALDWVSKISQYNRQVGTQDYHDIAEKVMNELKTYGLDELKHHKYPADGKTKTWEWVVTQSWEVKSGILRLIEPKKELICRFQDIPMCVLGRSKSCDVTAELIDIGKGTEDEFKDLDLTGKIVLMEAPRNIISTQLAEKGALGIIVYPGPERTRGAKGMTIYNRFPAQANDLDKVTFGFGITFEQGLYLKSLLNKGLVKLSAKIDAELYDGELEVISAAIRGSEKPKEEIILTAHLCHPAAGVNDNASGSAGLLELARSLSTLIKQNILEPPRRTIRFLWVPEFHGTFPWVKEHEQAVKNALFNINLDMIGEHPVIIGEPCEICLGPYSRPSILNDLIQYLTKIIADHPRGVAINGTQMQMRYRVLPYSGGSDHGVFVARPINIPGIMIGHEDPFWHSSLDTIEKCDSTELKRNVAIALCTSYLFSIQNRDTLITLWPIVESNFYKRLGKLKEMIYTLYNKLNKETMTDSTSNEELSLMGKTLIDMYVDYENSVLNSIKSLGSLSPFVEELYQGRIKEIVNLKNDLKSSWKDLCKHLSIDLDTIENPDYFNQKWVPTFLGRKNLVSLLPIYLSSEYLEFKVPEPPDVWGGDFQEMINFIGLSLNLIQICAILTLEYHNVFYPRTVLNLTKLLEEKEFIKKLE
jgi:hypothetical protein